MDQNNLLDELNEFIQGITFKTGFQYLKDADKIYIFVGFVNEFIDQYLQQSNIEFENYGESQYIKIFKILYNNQKIFVCNFPCIKDIQQPEDNKNYSISRFLAQNLIKKIEKLKVFYIIDDKNTQKFDRQALNYSARTYLFTTAQVKPQFILTDQANVQILIRPDDFFIRIFNLANSQAQQQHFLQIIIFDQLSLEYIQPKIEQFVSPKREKLLRLQQTLQYFSYFPSSTQQFDKIYHEFLVSTAAELKIINNKCYFDILECINKNIIQKTEAINQQLLNLFQFKDQNFKQFCQNTNLKYNTLCLNFQMDVKEYRNIYTKLHPLNIPVDWNIELIILLKQFIIFQSNYVQTIKKNDWENRIQYLQDIEIEQIEQQYGVFLLGLTQIGKSTFASILDDCQQVVRSQDENENYFYEQINQEPVFRINQTFFSNTERIIKFKQIENFIINDCPGLNDTFEEFRIINALNIQNQINHYQSQIIVIVLDCSNKKQFIQSFKETINCLRIFNQDFFIIFQSKIVLLLSKHPKNDPFDNEFRKLLLQQPDLQNYIDEIRIFLQLLHNNRFIKFYQARYEANLQQFRSEVIYVLNQRIQPNYDFNNQDELRIQINNQGQFTNILSDLQNFIQTKINFFAQFIFKDLINKIQFDMQKPLKEKKKVIKCLQNIIQSQQLSFQQFYDQIKKWCIDNKYKIFQFQISELKHLHSLNKIINQILQLQQSMNKRF